MDEYSDLVLKIEICARQIQEKTAKYFKDKELKILGETHTYTQTHFSLSDILS